MFTPIEQPLDSAALFAQATALRHEACRLLSRPQRRRDACRLLMQAQHLRLAAYQLQRYVGRPGDQVVAIEN